MIKETTSLPFEARLMMKESAQLPLGVWRMIKETTFLPFEIRLMI
jgi:hypothetical protein